MVYVIWLKILPGHMTGVSLEVVADEHVSCVRYALSHLLLDSCVDGLPCFLVLDFVSA